MVLATVLLGTFVGTVNNSVANVAVLDVTDDFDVAVGTGAWFVTGYVLAFAVLMPVAGRLADVYGTRRVAVVGMVAFLAASVGVATAPGWPWALAGRVAQGVANAPVLPTVMVTVAAVFPAGERGRAMGVWAAVNGAAVALGPPIGGVLTDAFGWRSVFWADVPLVLVVLVLTIRYLPDVRPPRARGDGDRVDVASAVLLSAGLVTTMVGLGQASEGGWGWPAAATLGPLGAALLLVWWWHLARARSPLVDPALLRNRTYAVLGGIAALQMMVLFGVLFTTPLMLVVEFERPVGTAGLLVFVLPVSMVAAGPALGHLADRRGTASLTRAGGAVLAGAAAVLAAGAAWRSLGVVLAGLVLVGLGVAAIQAPAAVGVAEAVGEAARGAGLGLFHTIRFVGGVMGTALFAGAFALTAPGADLDALAPEDVDGPFAVVFLLAAGLGLGAAALAGRLRTIGRGGGARPRPVPGPSPARPDPAQEVGA
jgi:MFS family permease